jgi:transcriptional regulator with XRE-family HTH domain
LFLNGRDKLKVGRSSRSRPKKLAGKLKLIRTRLGLTQPELIAKLNVRNEPLYATTISAFEKGRREPPLTVLLRYARVYGCTVEELIDDQMKLRN